ncbi:unnamed protein product, partial [Mesorhabditis spiculigera]
MATDVQKFARRFGFGLAAVAVGGSIVLASSYYVKTGRRAVIVDRSTGPKENTVAEGLHFLIPFKQKAVIFDIRSKKKNLRVQGKSKDDREVVVVLRFTFHPDPDRLVTLYARFGDNYDQFLFNAVEEIVYYALEQNSSSTLDADREGIRNKIINDAFALFGNMNVVLEDIDMTKLLVDLVPQVKEEIQIPCMTKKNSEKSVQSIGLEAASVPKSLLIIEERVDETVALLPTPTPSLPKDEPPRSRRGSYRVEIPKTPEYSVEKKEIEHKELVIEAKPVAIYENLPTSSDIQTSDFTSTTSPKQPELALEHNDTNTFSWSEEMEKDHDHGDRKRGESQVTPDSDQASVDSGRATAPPAMHPIAGGEIVPQYEFEIHNSYVGLVIGVGGKTIKELSTRTGVVLEIRPHYSPEKVDTHQICQVRGKREQINRCLCMLRNRFPPERFPELNLQPVLAVPSISYQSDDQLQPTWLALPECVSTEVTVSAVVNPSHFFLQQPTHPSFNSLALLDHHMLQNYANAADVPGLDDDQLIAGVVCAVRVLDAWFRAMTVSYCDESDEMLVRFVDYGGYTCVVRDDLRQIRSDFLALPFQAVECYLAHVEPIDGSWIWSDEAHEVVQNAVGGKILEAHIVGYHIDDRMPYVELTLPEEQDKAPMRIDQLLMQLGLAKRADPSQMQRVPRSKVWNQMNGGAANMSMQL